MVTDRDLTAAILIALLILIGVLCVWPGLLRVRGGDLAGFWASPAGGLYEIRPTGARSFVVRSASPHASDAIKGTVAGVRGVRVAGRAGRVELGGRHINWAGGDRWTRQGVAPRA